MSGERHAVTLITHAIIGDCRPTNLFLNELLLVAKKRIQGLCEIRGGRPGLPVPNSPYGLSGHRATLNLNVTKNEIY